MSKQHQTTIVFLLALIAGLLLVGTMIGGVSAYHYTREASVLARARRDAQQEAAKAAESEKHQKRLDDWNFSVYKQVEGMERDGKAVQEIMKFQDEHVNKPPTEFVGKLD
jgi:hypothetical protein